MTQKIIKVGSSLGMTLSKQYVKDLGLNVGDQIEVQVNNDKKLLEVRPVRRTPAVDAELAAWTKKFVHRYQAALNELASK